MKDYLPYEEISIQIHSHALWIDKFHLQPYRK